MSKNKSLTANSIFYLIYNVINVIFPFITGIYVTHILIPDAIGQVEIARNFVQYFVILSYLGIPTYALREISKYRKEKNKLNEIYSELMIINFISTLVFSLLYLILIFVIPQYRKNIILFLIVGISIVINVFNNSWLFEALEEFKYIAIRNLIFKIFSFVLLIIFVKKPNDYLIYAAITVIGTVGNYILNIVNSKKFIKITFKNLNLKRHLKSIFLLVVVNLAIEIYSLIDITMLGFMSSKKNVAFYSYGMKIHNILLKIINTFTVVLVPKIAMYYKENNLEEYNRTITKTLKVIILIAIPTIIGIWFTSDYLLCSIYGNDYINSSYVLKILSLTLLISPIGYLLGSRVCLVTNNEDKMVIPVGCGAIINIILNYCLIKKYQEIGAALASVVSELAVMIIYILLSKKYFKLENIKNSILKIIFAVIIITVYLAFTVKLKISELYITLIQIIGAIIIYFILLLIFKEDFTYNFFMKLLNNFKVIKKKGNESGK